MVSLVAERLQRKTENIQAMLRYTGNDWEEVVYRLVARYFGLRVNSDTFELLAKALPYKIILKHADNLIQVEALLFGTAGLLDGEVFKDAVNDNYYKILVREFKVLSSKYSLKPIHGWLWKFARLRPANFPTVRIAQMARLLTSSEIGRAHV